MSFKTIYASEEYVDDEILKSKADWNQNDETAPDYVKNRPFWTESSEQFIIPETTVTPTNDGILTLPAFTLEKGVSYTVNWNGTDYVCEPQFFNVKGLETYLFLGNTGSLASMGGIDSGEPFLYMYSPNNATFGALEAFTTVTISVRAVLATHHKLDLKYLPSLVVNLSKSDSTESGYVVDKSYEEIKEAINNGWIVRMKYDAGGVAGALVYYLSPLASYDAEAEGLVAIHFGGIASNLNGGIMLQACVINPDNTVGVEVITLGTT